MKNKLRFRCVATTLAVAMALCLGGAAVIESAGVVAAIRLGVGCAWAVSLLGYLGLSWALGRSDKQYFGIFGGGFFLRLGVLAALAFGAPTAMRDQLHVLLIAYVAGLLVFLLTESRYLIEQQKV